MERRVREERKREREKKNSVEPPPAENAASVALVLSHARIRLALSEFQRRYSEQFACQDDMSAN
jgi:hypothetical protein